MADVWDVDAQCPIEGTLLNDVWPDVTAVRHKKFKTEERGQVNQLSTKILERCVQMTTHEGDLVLDPFGGSGTTFEVCERLKREWIGCEFGNCASIVARLQRMEGSNGVEPHKNNDIIIRDDCDICKAKGWVTNRPAHGKVNGKTNRKINGKANGDIFPVKPVKFTEHGQMVRSKLLDEIRSSQPVTP